MTRYASALACAPGRTIDEKEVEYTPIPGHVGGFGAMVDRVGRGMPRAVACGKEFMVVATYPYQGEARSGGWMLSAHGCHVFGLMSGSLVGWSCGWVGAGPTEEVAMQLSEERRLRDQEAALQQEQQAILAKALAGQTDKLKTQVSKVRGWAGT